MVHCSFRALPVCKNPCEPIRCDLIGGHSGIRRLRLERMPAGRPAGVQSECFAGHAAFERKGNAYVDSRFYDGAMLTGMISAGSLVIAVLQFKAMGPVFTNAYLPASPQEREKLNKKLEYRLAAVVFSVLCLLFALVTLGIAMQLPVLFFVAIAGGILLVAYVVAWAAGNGVYR